LLSFVCQYPFFVSPEIRLCRRHWCSWLQEVQTQGFSPDRYTCIILYRSQVQNKMMHVGDEFWYVKMRCFSVCGISIMQIMVVVVVVVFSKQKLFPFQQSHGGDRRHHNTESQSTCPGTCHRISPLKHKKMLHLGVAREPREPHLGVECSNWVLVL